MNKPPYPVSPRSAATSTMMSASQVTSTLKLADNLRDDPDKDKRLAVQRCLPCHYIVRLAGQAFTQQPCGICLVDQTYPSTSTDVLCLPCASARELCKHCGGDLHLRTDRRKWWQVADPCSLTHKLAKGVTHRLADFGMGATGQNFCCTENG